MAYEAINTPGQQPNRAPMRAGCPITRQHLSEVRLIRREMVRLGCPTIAVHSPWSRAIELANAGKQPLTEMRDNKKQPWTRGHSPDRLNYVTPVSANTGLVLGGDAALVALDVDPLKGASDGEQQAFMRDVLRTLRADQLWSKLELALMRLRPPASIVVLMRADKTMSKMKVAGERGAVELLGDGQHVVVHGWHPRSLEGDPVCWTWRGGRSPWAVPVSDLPTIPAMEIESLMHRIGLSGVLGAERLQRPPNIGTSGQVRRPCTTPLRDYGPYLKSTTGLCGRPSVNWYSKLALRGAAGTTRCSPSRPACIPAMER